MIREEIVNRVGLNYLKSNDEQSEFIYPKAFQEKGIKFVPIKKTGGAPGSVLIKGSY